VTGAEAARAALPRPVFRGPLAGQKPRVVGTFSGDPWLVIAVAALVGLGTVMVFNVSYFWAEKYTGDPLYFFRKHVLSIGLGFAAGVGTSRLSSDRLRSAAYPLLVGILVALVAVLVPGIGMVHNGARRWLHVGPLSLQPSELAKFAVVLYLARSIARKGARMEELQLGVVPHCIVVGTVALLVLVEPDFGTAVVCGGMLGAMLFVGGVRLWHVGLLAAGLVPVAAYEVLHKTYRSVRILGFLHPDLDPLGINHQLRQSFIAFGSGGFWGVGLGESQQKMFFLPAAHTDFIFAVVGEELGLAGALLVLGLFAVVAWRGFRIAVRHPDEFASLLAFGTTLLLVLQGTINVAVVLGLLPTKGLALPFISYGGSAMIAALAEAGVLVALAREAG
jgi:cell division protein FtsW